ncbi:MAG: hypothetical protein ATN36_07605 [Epulopiscium sp. Nele67-Bin005]|nr:MAG: hypothetical protein ATN36_07605 [Epulopiscium sp. Nele67-Bin005]
MKIEVNTKIFDQLVNEHQLFEKTYALMCGYLKAWYNEVPEDFLEEIGVDFDAMLDTYDFQNSLIALGYNYVQETNYIVCSIHIHDEETRYWGEYKAFFDYNLEFIEDILTK